jgi:hypothetical protein
MEIKNLNSQIKYVNEYEEQIIDSNEEETVIFCMKSPEVCYVEEALTNVQYCIDNNIPHVHLKNLSKGGCIVAAADAVVMNIKRRLDGGYTLAHDFSIALENWLIEKGLPNVERSGNDILVDGYKVASGSTVLPKGIWQYMTYHVSMNQDLPLIEKVCNKPMEKVPKGLAEWGIVTKEDVLQFCKDYWSKN